MRLIMIGVAAALAAAAPATAQQFGGNSLARGGAGAGQFARGNAVRVHRGQSSLTGGVFSGSTRGDRRGGYGNGYGDAYLPYREYQGDTLFRSDGFNDWWHDRPDRALPRWVRANGDCERRYWMGGGWRC